MQPGDIFQAKKNSKIIYCMQQVKEAENGEYTYKYTSIDGTVFTKTCTKSKALIFLYHAVMYYKPAQL